MKSVTSTTNYSLLVIIDSNLNLTQIAFLPQHNNNNLCKFHIKRVLPSFKFQPFLIIC